MQVDNKYKRAIIYFFAVFAATLIVAHPLDNTIYLNPSDLLMAFFVSYASPDWAFFLAGTACTLVDITIGYSNYCIATFMVKGVEAFLLAKLYYRYNKKFSRILGVMELAALGYVIYDCFIFGPQIWFFTLLMRSAQVLGCGTIYYLYWRNLPEIWGD